MALRMKPKDASPTPMAVVRSVGEVSGFLTIFLQPLSILGTDDSNSGAWGDSGKTTDHTDHTDHGGPPFPPS
jgi:hypothetical protein